MTAEKGFSRRDVFKLLGAGSGLVFLHCGPASALDGKKDSDYDWDKHYWGYAVDINKCIGCGACMRGCRAENDVPPGSHRTWVERYRISKDGKVAVDVAKDGEHVFEPPKAGESISEEKVDNAFFVPKLCNHCEKSVCTQVCPVGASYHTKDGVVLVDHKQCVGCGYCIQACPYGTRYLHPKTHTADKCTLCYHRITKGKMPACVHSCPTGARIFGDMKDPKSKINRVLEEHRHRFLKPELGTNPKCYYLGLDVEVV